MPRRARLGSTPSPAHRRPLRGEVGERRERVGTHRVQQHHSGNLVGVLGCVRHDIGTTCGVTDEHVRSGFTRALQQVV